MWEDGGEDRMLGVPRRQGCLGKMGRGEKKRAANFRKRLTRWIRGLEAL